MSSVKGPEISAPGAGKHDSFLSPYFILFFFFNLFLFFVFEKVCVCVRAFFVFYLSALFQNRHLL